MNYVILIGNGFPKDDIAGSPLSNVEGSTTQLSMPQFTTTSGTVTTTIGQRCGSGGNVNSALSACTSSIPQSLKDANPADSWACVSPAIRMSVRRQRPRRPLPQPRTE